VTPTAHEVDRRTRLDSQAQLVLHKDGKAEPKDN
jgi:hypothetical protein